MRRRKIAGWRWVANGLHSRLRVDRLSVPPLATRSTLPIRMVSLAVCCVHQSKAQLSRHGCYFFLFHSH